MLTSFAFLPYKNSISHNKLVKKIESHFDIVCDYSQKKKSIIYDKKLEFLLELNENKLHFIILNNEKKDDNFNSIRKFISENFRNQIIGLKPYDNLDNDVFNNIDGVQVITI